MARTFTRASSERIVTSLGALGFAFGPATVAVITRLTSNPTAYAGIMAVGANDPGSWMLWTANGNLTFWNAAADTASPFGFSSTEGWCLIAATKATGSVPIRFHKYVFSTNTWTHQDSVASAANSPTPTTRGIFGSHADDAGFYDGSHAIAGAWNVALTDAQIEALPFSLPGWFQVQPKGLWLFDQSAVGQKLVDFSGGGANESAITGTSVAAASVPVFNYSDGIWLPTIVKPGAVGDQSITGAGAIASAEGIGSHTLTPGAVTVSPTGIAGAEAFGTARLDLNVTGAGAVASGEAVGAHTLTPGAVTVSPGGIASGEAVGNPLIGQGVAGAGGIASGEAFGVATITPGPVTVSPSGVTSGEAFGQATLSGGAAGSSPRQLPTLGVG